MAVQFSTKFLGLSETVPDTQTKLCLRCKIGKSIRVYSANTRNKYGVYRVYGVFGELLYAAGRQDSCSVTGSSSVECVARN